MNENIGSLLSAASLLLAALGVLFGFWYRDITAALETKPDTFKENRRKQFLDVNAVFQTKALPLAASAILLSMVLLPDAVSITWESASLYYSRGIIALPRNYCAVRTAFCLVVALATGQAAYSSVLLCKLWGLRSRLH